jgi:hypothetical protein
MDTFLYFFVRLHSRFYTFVLFFAFNVYIYSSSLKLFMIDPVVSLQPATHQQYFMLPLPLPLRWLRVTVVLNTMIALNELFIRPVT